MRALPYNSQAKGVIERINQIYTPAAKRLPTYVGKDMDKEQGKKKDDEEAGGCPHCGG